MSRLISERILDSDKVNSLSVAGERLYVRWYLITDKNGVAPADPAVLREKLFPKKPKLNVPTVKMWADEVIASGLVTPIKGKNGEPYVRFYRFHDFNQKLKHGGTYDVGIIEGMTGGSSADEGGVIPTMRGVSLGGEDGIIPPKSPEKLENQSPDVDERYDEKNDVYKPTSSTSDQEPDCPNSGSSSCLRELACPNPDPALTSDTPAKMPVQKAKPAAAPQQSGDPLRGWSQNTGDVPAERIRLCVRWKLDLAPEDWYRKNITPKALGTPGFIKKLDTECPDSAVIEQAIRAARRVEWKYDPNCPHHCDRGKITFIPEGKRFPQTKHCECFHEVEVA
jgi:hypothetical protein